MINMERKNQFHTISQGRNLMKNRLFFQKVLGGLAVLAALILTGCNADILNALRNPEDFYAKKGGLMIYNISSSDAIKGVEIKDAYGDLVEDVAMQDDSGQGLVPIEKERVRGIVLDPGKYTVAVTYTSGTDPAPRTVTIEWKKNIAQYFSNGTAVSNPYGTLQIINFSGKNVTSVKLRGTGEPTEMLATTPPTVIADKATYSWLINEPGTYELAVQLQGEPAAFTTDNIKIRAGEITAIMVIPTGMEEIAPTPVAESINLWVLNRLVNTKIKSVEKRLAGVGNYEVIPGTAIVAGGYTGVHLDGDTYDFKINFDLVDPDASLIKEAIALSALDPVFLIVAANPESGAPEIEKVTSGDVDEDGFPDWWERQYFGEDAVTDPAIPSKDGDEDGDGLTNGEEFTKGTKPTVMDSDGDGLTDWEEVNGKRDTNYANSNRPTPFNPSEFPSTFTKTNPLNPDTDGDGYSDYVEIRDGSSPTDTKDIPNGQITIVVPWGETDAGKGI